MPLEAQTLTALVFADHLSNFPEALKAVRSNLDTGVPHHNIPEAFVTAECEAVVSVLQGVVISDIGTGTADVPGIAAPVPFSFPAKTSAEALFLSTQGWTGPQSAKSASVLIGAILTRVSQISLLYMDSNPLMGTGTGVVSPLSNPGLEALLTPLLLAALLDSFKSSGKFGQGDIPGNPVNATLSAQLPRFAASLAHGLSSITTAVVYVGNTSTVAPVAGVMNTGAIR